MKLGRPHCLLLLLLTPPNQLPAKPVQPPPTSFQATAAKAEKGDPASQSALGDYYLDGKQFPRDLALALKWYRKAAEQGFAAAQYHVGVSYSRGECVPQD